MTSSSYASFVSVGQPSPVGRSSSESYDSWSGFRFGLSAETDVTSPTIDHSTVSASEAGSNINITATIADESSGVAMAFLFYRRGGQSEFTEKAMDNTGGENFLGTIPGSFVGARGVEYYITGVDSASNSRTTEHYPVVVSLTDLAITEALAASSYRMISSPIQPSDGSPQNILLDDLGEYDDREWRLGRWSPGDDGYHEYTVNWDHDTDDFTPGRGFWLIVKDGASIDVSGNSVGFSDSFAITLQPGWNQIGCPFAFAVSWDDVTTGDDVEEPQAYVNNNYETAAQLEPWKGYFIKNNSSGSVDINVPPLESGSSPGAAPAAPEETFWELGLSVRCGEYKDTYNYLGVSHGASHNRDRLDRSEPPPPWSYVSLYFPHEEWERNPGNYRADYRPEFVSGEMWEFVVETDQTQSQVELDVDGIESIPDWFEVNLLDRENGEVVNLREETGYAYATGTNASLRQFYIVIGLQAYVESTREQLLPVPESYALAQNRPNPFSDCTEIHFQIPAHGDEAHRQITLTVYDLLGREVATVLDESRRPGYYSVNWDGKDRSRRNVASGTYGYRLSVDDGQWSETRQMVLLR